MDIDRMLREFADIKSRLGLVERRPHAGEMAEKITGDLGDWQKSVEARLSAIEAALAPKDQADETKPKALDGHEPEDDGTKFDTEHSELQ